MQIRVAGHCRALLLYALCALAGTAAAAPLQAQWSFRLLPGDPPATRQAVDAIMSADLVALGPGS